MSTLTWLDFSDAERKRALQVVELLGRPETRDELGLGAIRDAFANALFPGMSTVQRRAPTLDEAKALAAEIDDRPPIPESEQLPHHVAVIPEPGTEYVAYATSIDPPTEPRDCGTKLAPEPVKPHRELPEWWDDPSAFWRCPACGSHRGDVAVRPWLGSEQHQTHAT